jgi:hypothetical protein
MNALSTLTAVLSLALLSTQVHAANQTSPAPAQGTEFSFRSSPVTPEAYGNSYSATLDGLTLTATAWSTTGKKGALETAELEIYSGYGMGVCSRSEGVNCLSKGNNHALDNKGADDLILFTFSSAVELDTLKLLQFGGDSDLSLWAGSGAINLNGLTTGGLGTATLINNNIKKDGDRTIDLGSVLGGSYDWLAVAARIGQNNDFAKLQSLTVNHVAQPVPDAATWMTMLAGLGLVGFRVSRRQV